MTTTDTDHSDLAPPDQTIELAAEESLLFGGITFQGSKAERKAMFSALAKAQGAFTPVLKDTENTFFKSRYAGLDNVIAAIRPALAANGLFFAQPIVEGPHGKQLHTTVTHAEGAVMHMALELNIPANAKVQELGSLVTYMRRYSLQSAFGIAAEVDDDGNAASGRDAPPQKQRQAPDPKPASGLTRDEVKAVQTVAELQSRDQATLPVNGHKSEPPPPLKAPAAEMITKEQGGLIKAEFERLGWTWTKAGEHALKITGMTSKTMTKAAADVLLFDLKGREAEAL